MGISFFKSALLEEAGFGSHGFTKITGGVSLGPYTSLNLSFDVGDKADAVAENRRRLQAATGLDAPLVTVRQVHGTVAVDAADASNRDWTAPPVDEGDIVVSNSDAVPAVHTADCAAVLLADTETRVVAAVHAGWRGTAGGVIRKALRAMIDRGASPFHILAAIGPCIGSACCEVGPEVARALPESVDPMRKKPGKYLLDLENAVEVSLIVSGIPSTNIDKISKCTHCLEADLFSYRRSGGTCGRMLGFISASC